MPQPSGPQGHLPITAARGFSYPFVKLKHANDPISGIGALKAPGRYHVQGRFRALYTSENPIAALKETEFLVKSKPEVAFKPAPPMVLFALEYHLERVLDLRDPTTLALLGVKREHLFAAWLRGTPENPRPTQRIARLAYEAGVQALFAPTAVPPHETTNVIVFPDNLKVGGQSWVQVSNPDTIHTFRIP